MCQSNSFTQLGVKGVQNITTDSEEKRKHAVQYMTHTNVEVNDLTNFSVNIEACLELGAPNISSKERSGLVLPFIPLSAVLSFITWNS